MLGHLAQSLDNSCNPGGLHWTNFTNTRQNFSTNPADKPRQKLTLQRLRQLWNCTHRTAYLLQLLSEISLEWIKILRNFVTFIHKFLLDKLNIKKNEKYHTTQHWMFSQYIHKLTWKVIRKQENIIYTHLSDYLHFKDHFPSVLFKSPSAFFPLLVLKDDFWGQMATFYTPDARSIIQPKALKHLRKSTPNSPWW